MLTGLIKKELIQETGTLNQKIFNSIKKNIFEKKIPGNSKLPSSRELAINLGVSRNTILLVYEQLYIEGYVYIKKNSGTFVKNSVDFSLLEDTTVIDVQPSNRGYAILKNNYISTIMKQRLLTPFVPDVSIFPHAKFNKIVAQVRSSTNYSDFTYSSDAGVEQLKEAITKYLKNNRHIECKTSQVLIFRSSTDALNLISKVLCDTGDTVWLENPTYWGFRNIFHTEGLNICDIDVDKEGLNFESFISIEDVKPSLILVTPSRQYPLGHVMSLERRIKLVHHAIEQGSWIIEDDYDSDFRLSRYQVSSLYSLEKNAPVIYLGSFSKTIYPSINISYLVVPERVASILKHAHSVLYRNSDRIMQRALAIFMEKGDYSGHLNYIRSLYLKRRQVLIQLLVKYLGKKIVNIESNFNTGLHIILQLPMDVDDLIIVHELQTFDINVSALSQYYSGMIKQRGLLIGFASISEEKMEAPIKILTSVVQQHLKNR